MPDTTLDTTYVEYNPQCGGGSDFPGSHRIKEAVDTLLRVPHQLVSQKLLQIRQKTSNVGCFVERPVAYSLARQLCAPPTVKCQGRGEHRVQEASKKYWLFAW